MAGNSKNFLSPFLTINAQSMGASVTSAVTDVRFLDNIGFQVIWTGTPTGSFDVQGSMDYALGSGSTVLNAGTWTSIPLSGLVNPAGSASNIPISITEFPFPYIRLVYTRVSGTGTLNAYISAKAV